MSDFHLLYVQGGAFIDSGAVDYSRARQIFDAIGPVPKAFVHVRDGVIDSWYPNAEQKYALESRFSQIMKVTPAPAAAAAGGAATYQVGVYKVQLKTAHNKFICAEADHTLNANRDGAGAWETFDMYVQPGNKVAFKTAHNKWLCAEADGSIVANRDGQGAWETFDLIPQPNGFALKTVHNKFVVAEADCRIIANRDAVGAWETLQPIWTANSPIKPAGATVPAGAGAGAGPSNNYQPGIYKVQLKTAHNKFVCVEGNHTVIANRDGPGAWETLEMHLEPGNRVGFQTAHGTWLCAEGDGTIVADRYSQGAWETFQLVPQANGFALKTVHGKFVAAESDCRLVANRDGVGAWETFHPVWVSTSPTAPTTTVTYYNDSVTAIVYPSVVVGRPDALKPGVYKVQLKTAHNKFICAEADHTLNANRDGAGDWETYEMHVQTGNKVAFKSAHNKWLCAEADGSIVANRDGQGAWETFEAVPQSGGFAFKTAHNKYMVAEGDLRIKADRDGIGAWEIFQTVFVGARPY